MPEYGNLWTRNAEPVTALFRSYILINKMKIKPEYELSRPVPKKGVDMVPSVVLKNQVTKRIGFNALN